MIPKILSLTPDERAIIAQLASEIAFGYRNDMPAEVMARRVITLLAQHDMKPDDIATMRRHIIQENNSL